MSRKPRLARRLLTESLAHEALVQHAVERHRMIVAHAGGDAVLQFFEHDRGDARHIEAARLGDRQPDQFDQFRIRPDQAVDAMRDAPTSAAKKRLSKRSGRFGGVMARAMKWIVLRSGRMPALAKASQAPGGVVIAPACGTPSIRPVSS